VTASPAVLDPASVLTAAEVAAARAAAATAPPLTPAQRDRVSAILHPVVEELAAERAQR
jgi:hypothetical protein